MCQVVNGSPSAAQKNRIQNMCVSVSVCVCMCVCVCVCAGAVSYTHLTLPTTAEV